MRIVLCYPVESHHIEQISAAMPDAEIVDAYLAEWRPVELWQLTRYHEGTVVAGETLVQLWAVTSASCMW